MSGESFFGDLGDIFKSGIGAVIDVEVAKRAADIDSGAPYTGGNEVYTKPDNGVVMPTGEQSFSLTGAAPLLIGAAVVLVLVVLLATRR